LLCYDGDSQERERASFGFFDFDEKSAIHEYQHSQTRFLALKPGTIHIYRPTDRTWRLCTVSQKKTHQL